MGVGAQQQQTIGMLTLYCILVIYLYRRLNQQTKDYWRDDSRCEKTIISYKEM